MPLLARFRSATRLFAVFAVVTTTLAGALVWVSWRLIQQDRELERQRRQDRLGQVLDATAAGLLRRLSEREQQLVQLASVPSEALGAAVATATQDLSDDSAIVVLDEHRAAVAPAGRIVFFPTAAAGPEAGGPVFATGESAEYRRHDLEAARDAYASIARSPSAAVRAGALLRLARVYRTMKMPERALAAYADLARVAESSVASTTAGARREGDGDATPTLGGAPVGLVARHATCQVLAENGRRDALRAAALALRTDLMAGRWRITRGQWAYYVDETRGWLGPGDAANLAADGGSATAIALSGALEQAWRAGQTSPAAAAASARVDYWREGGRTWIVLSSRSAGRLVVLLAGPREVSGGWLGRHQALAGAGIALGMSDAAGEVVVPIPAGAVNPVVRTSVETGLPWTLHAAAVGPLPAAAAPRTLLLAGIGALALLLAAGAFFIGRAITRELEVARMQSDFVAAVSHEFRTPLASVCHLSEMLVDGRVADEERRERLYRTLQRESERLKRLVEGLLDFARMDAGGRQYRLERVETTPFLRALGDEFAADAAVQEATVDVDIPAELPVIQADQEALGRAIWNLLDNAVKYSPRGPRVRLEARSVATGVEVSVTDEGLGIPPDEQASIFQKFARGSAAATSGVKGTGLGLSMVRHIVEAHGGTIRVDSRPAEGSTFTIALPASQ
jgi:signal transduction histidine kinase